MARQSNQAGKAVVSLALVCIVGTLILLLALALAVSNVPLEKLFVL